MIFYSKFIFKDPQFVFLFAESICFYYYVLHNV